MVDEKYFFRLALNQPRHALPVARSQHKRLQDEQVERSLQQGDAVVVICLGSHSTQVLPYLGRMSTQTENITDAAKAKPPASGFGTIEGGPSRPDSLPQSPTVRGKCRRIANLPSVNLSLTR